MARTFLLRTIRLAVLAIAPAWCARAAESNPPSPSIDVVIDADIELGEVYNFWNVFPVTVQEPFLDASKHESLRKTYRYANYINCVRFLGGINLEKDDFFRGVDDDGAAICVFSEGIAMLSGIRECGFTPWIVLDNVPAAMCDNPVENRYGNTEPPKDYKVWDSYVRQLVQALITHFGRDEVNQWRFRVGTEPDLKPGHWTGTKEQYFAHYDHTVAAVRSVLPDAKIGPGNVIDPVKKRKWKSWGIEIIDHCAEGTNTVTGEVGTPMSFFASSYYTAVGVSDERFDTLVGVLRDRLARYPQFAKVPVEIQEFGILSEGGKWIVGDGTEFSGSWFAHFADKIYDSRVRRVYQWWWNTNKGGEIPISLNHVMDMLGSMVGGARLSEKVSRSTEEDHVGCIAAEKGGEIDLVVFRHLAARGNGEAVPVHVTLQGELVRQYEWTVSRGSVIDGEHPGFFHERKADMAKAQAEAGENASPYGVAFQVMTTHRAKYESMSVLSALNPLPELTVENSGAIRFNLRLDGHSVVHLHLKPKL